MDKELSLTPSQSIRPLVYEVLKAITCDEQEESDLTIKQNMGVALTNTIKKEGVNIIQLQNVRVSNAIPKIIEVLEMLDALEHIPPVLLEAETVEQIPAPSLDPIDILCEFAYKRKMDWKTISNILKIRYCDYAKIRSGDGAYELLGLARSTIHQTKQRLAKGGITDVYAITDTDSTDNG